MPDPLAGEYKAPAHQQTSSSLYDRTFAARYGDTSPADGVFVCSFSPGGEKGQDSFNGPP